MKMNGEQSSNEDCSYLQVVIQTATQVHLSERHVGQLGTEEHSEFGTDVQRCPPCHSLLFRRDVHIILVELPQVFLQGQTLSGPLQVRLSGATSSHSSSTHSPTQAV